MSKNIDQKIWAWQQIPSPIVSEILCKSSDRVNGVVLDTEHSPYNRETLYTCIQTIDICGKTPIVRLPSVDKDRIKLVLDAGARGIIFSTIESASGEVYRKLIQSRYPSQGGRRGLGLTRSNRWGLDNLITDSPFLVAQIETVAGVNCLDEIVSSNIFDYFMIGPYDLSSSLGDPGNFESTDFKQCVHRILEKIPSHKMAIHIPRDIREQVNKYSSYAILALGMDTTFIVDQCRDFFDDRL